MVQGSSAAAADDAKPDELVDWRGTQRYEVVRRIGQGGMGAVYEARDLERRQRVALKTLLHFDPAAFLQFKQEFRTLADVQHPNLVRLYEFVATEGERVFFAMELVRGTDFFAYVRPGSTHDGGSSDGISVATIGTAPSGVQRRSTPPTANGVLAASTPTNRSTSAADIDRLRPAFRQLVEGVQALHAAGKLHRDLKPSNVRVSVEGRVVLLDFGIAVDLAHRAHEPPSEENETVGTAHYMAPEQAFGETPTPASDWYSVGVMLYEALVGSPPFVVGSFYEIIEAKNSVDAPPPSASVDGVPPELDALCTSLLHRDPARRATGREILRRIGAVRSSAPAGMFSSSAKALVGREPQLRALREAFELARTGHPVAVHVSGRAGMGKSALLQHFLDGLVEHEEAVVLRGRAYERESIPYKAVDAVVDALSRHLMHAPDNEGTIAMPQGMRGLARLFPVLRRVPGVRDVAEERDIDPRKIRRQAFGALRELLTTLALKRPLVVCIDDVQWGDTDSVALLLELVRPPHAPPVLLVMAHREEDTQTAPFLTEIRDLWPAGADAREVSVGPLSEEDSRRLSLAILDSDDPDAQAIAAAATREAEGSPFLLDELTRSSNGRLRATQETPLTLEQVIGERLAGLPEEARRVAELVAVGGRPVPVSTIGDAAGIASTADVVTLLSLRRFVRMGLRDGREVVEPIHDRIRETIVAQLSAPAARAHHANLARAFEANPGTDPEAIATHLFGAGENARAAEFAERAAKRAAAKLAFDQAARLYARAAEATLDVEAARRLRVRHAEALVLAGRGVQAARVYMRAAEGATAIESADFGRAAAQQLLMSGHIDEGGKALQSILASWGIALPRSALSAVFWLIVYRLMLAIRGLRFEERAAASVPTETRARIDAMHAVALGLSVVDQVQAACIQARHMILALDVGDSFQVMRAASLEATLLSARGGVETARERELYAIVERLAERSKDSEGHQVFYQAKTGIRHFLRGRWKQAREILDATYERYPNNRGSANSNFYLFSLYSLWMLGDLREVAKRSAHMNADAKQRGDLYTSVNVRTACPALTFVATTGDLDAARRSVKDAMSSWSHSGYSTQHWQASMVLTSFDLYAGDGVSAYARLASETGAVKRSFILVGSQFMRGYHRYVRGVAAVASIDGAPESRARRLAEARQLGRGLEKEGMVWTKPFAALLTAVASNASGDRRAAAEALRGAIDLAVTADMSMYAAAAHHRLGLLQGEGGRALVIEAESAMEAEDVRSPARFAAMLVPGRWQ